MSGLRILPKNFFDDAVNLAATSEASASLVVANLQSLLRDDVWRSTSLSAQTISWDWGGETRQVSATGLFPSKLGPSMIGSQVRLRYWSDQAKTTNVYDQTYDFFTPTGALYNVFPWGSTPWNTEAGDHTARLAPLIKFFTSFVAAAGQIDITNLGAVDTNYFEMSRIWVADYVEAPYNAATGAAPAWKPTSQLQRGKKSGSLHRQINAIFRELRFSTILDSEAERAAWSDLMYLCDLNEIVISLFPGDASARKERDFTVMGSFEVLNPLIFRSVDVHDLQLAILES